MPTAPTNGRTNGVHGPRPAARPPDAYLGPTCPVCHLPWAVHPNFGLDGKPVACAAHRPASAPFDSLAYSADRREVEAARGRFRARTAPAPTAAPTPAPAPTRRWAVLVRVPGDPSGEPAPTGDFVEARDEAGALAKAGTLCATGRVAVREVGGDPPADAWRRGEPANIGAGEVAR